MRTHTYTQEFDSDYPEQEEVYSEQEEYLDPEEVYSEQEDHSYYEDEFCSDEIPEPPETTTTSALQLYEGSALTSLSSSLLIFQYKMRHQLTEAALADLLQLIQMHCPSPNQCPASVFQLNKHFPDMNYKVQLHHFCSRCMQSINIGCHKTCTNEFCNTDLGSPNAISAFIEVPIESQLKVILESESLTISTT